VLDYDSAHVAILESTAFVGERKVLYDRLTAAELIASPRLLPAVVERIGREIRAAA